MRSRWRRGRSPIVALSVSYLWSPSMQLLGTVAVGRERQVSQCCPAYDYPHDVHESDNLCYGNLATDRPHQLKRSCLFAPFGLSLSAFQYVGRASGSANGVLPQATTRCSTSAAERSRTPACGGPISTSADIAVVRHSVSAAIGVLNCSTRIRGSKFVTETETERA